MQLHVSVVIFMESPEDLSTNMRLDRKLLAQLTREACFERFAGVAFSARELPAALEVHSLLPTREQEAAVELDDGRGDNRSLSGHHEPPCRYDRQLFDIGQTRHRGLRATHTMAPKSISAWLKSKTCRRGTSTSDTRHS